MSYDLIDKKDPRVDAIFKGLENMERMINAMQTAPRPAFHDDYFLTDKELSKLLKVSRRTLQEYRTLGVIPYYLIQGKALYKEPAFHDDYFLTDKELSKLLKVSRRTLQEYRTLGVIPYYLIQGKALYKESDIKKVLDNAYKRCREEQRWV